MVKMVRRCQYGDCKSDCRYMYKEYMKGVTFYRFPNPQKQDIKWKKWITACGLVEIAAIEPSYYSHTPKFVCSKHFVGGNGPTKLNPNPIPLDGKVLKINGFRQVMALGISHHLSDVPKPLDTTDDFSSVDGFIVDLNSAIVSSLNNDEIKCGLASRASSVPNKDSEISLYQNISEPCKFTNGIATILDSNSDKGCSVMVDDDQRSIFIPKQLCISTESNQDVEDATCVKMIEPCESTNRKDALILELNANVGSSIVQSLRPDINNDEHGSHVAISDCRNYSKVKFCEMPLTENPPSALCFQDLRTFVGCPLNWTAFYGPKFAKYSYEIENRLVFSYFVSQDMTTSLKILSNVISEHFVLQEIEERINCIDDILKSLKILQDYTICEGNSKKLFCFNLDESIGNGVYCAVTDAFHYNKCKLLVKKGKKNKRCSSCNLYRKTLLSYVSRKKNGKRKKLTVLSKKELIEKLTNLKTKQSYLTRRMKKLQNKLRKKI